jgi:hypothetical protein
MSKIVMLTWLGLAYTLTAWAQATPPTGTPVQIMVTVGHHYGHPPPTLTRDDLAVTQQYEPQPIINLTPLRGDRAGLELFVLVDECSNCEPGSKFEELRRFIGSQPSTTAVGVAYIANGRVHVAENPTQDRDRAVQALNAPAGSSPSSPFSALTELIHNWRQGSSRRVVLMISNGIDPGATDEPQNPSTEAAIEAAQRAGIAVYAIYHPSADYLTSDSSKVYSGQLRLAHLAYETGGEAYFLYFGPLPSLAPFLADISDHLANQYLLEFLANPSEGPGSLQEITAKSKFPDLELIAPGRVWVPGRRSGLHSTTD